MALSHLVWRQPRTERLVASWPCSSKIEGVLAALKTGLTGDLIAQDLRYALHHLGEITGQISNDDLLKNIFGKFCIGK